MFGLTRITDDYIECISQACTKEWETLNLNIMIKNQTWQIQPVLFQCRPNPIINDWYPKRSILRYATG